MLRRLMLLCLFIFPFTVSAQEEAFAMIMLLRGHEQPIKGLTISPDGQWIASWSSIDGDPGELFLWDVTTGEPLDLNVAVLHWMHRFGTKPDQIYPPAKIDHVRFSPDSRWLAVLNDPELLRLWNLQTGEGWAVYTGFCDCTAFRTPQTLIFSPNSAYLAELNANGDLMLLDLTGDAPVRIEHEFQPDADSPTPITTVAFSPDSTLLGAIQSDYERISPGISKVVKLFALKTGESLLDYSFDDGYTGDFITFSPDGKSLLAASSREGRLFLLDDLNDPLTVFFGWVEEISFSPNSQLIAGVMTYDPSLGIVYLGDTTDGIMHQELKSYGIASINHADFYFLPDSRPIYAIQHPAGTTITAFNPEWIPELDPAGTLEMRVNPANNYVAILDGTNLSLFDTGGDPAPLITLADPALDAEFFADGERLATYSGRLIAIYGRPDNEHPALPYALVVGQVETAGIQLRSLPDLAATGLGYVLQGEVLVGGVAASGEFAYLPEYDGWVRIGADYLHVEVENLPVLNP